LVASQLILEELLLWNPNITVRKIETGLEVNFTTSSLGLEYLILLVGEKENCWKRSCSMSCCSKSSSR
uniref:Uncharacterized protein n=1 Tax=Anser brachyrhynchus TaxID=132585 RepID=A0A8B9BKG1_9AVES